MSIIVLLSPIRFLHLFLLRIIINIFKTTIFSIQRDIIITSLFRKLTKVSTDNFRFEIKLISNLLEMLKNIMSA